LKIPGLVENDVMALLYASGININITNVFISCCVSEEDAGEVMSVELGSSFPCAFNADSGAKNPESSEIRPDTMPSFVRCHHNGTVNSAVMEVYCMEKSCRPKCSREPRAVEEYSDSDTKDVIPLLRCFVL
jgi:hypothetical protein